MKKSKTLFRWKIQTIKDKFLRMSKRNMIKVITICFWGYMLLSLIFILKEAFLELDLSLGEVFLELDWSQVSIQSLAVDASFILYCGALAVLKNLHVILIYLGFKFAIKRFKKDKLSAIDFEKYEGYYREILKDYSPAELSYIDDFEILPKKDIVATLLSLELNKKISLEDTDKIKIEQNNMEEVSNNEEYVLNSIENGKINHFNEDEFIAKVKEDAVKNGLLKETKIEWSKFKKSLILCIFFMILMICIFAKLFNDFINNPTNMADWKLFIMVFSMSLILCLPIFIGVFFYTYIMKSKKNEYIRTNKGEAINERLEGLKNYLEDFSLMQERDEKSLTLWEDYLIYSVIFNQNSKLIKSICDKYITI